MPDSRHPSDCSRCQGLCCVYPAFDTSEMFGLDKPSGEACPHLGNSYRCTIHAQLGPSGFRGCELYDCLGAGPRIIALPEFAGRSWRDDAPTATAMFSAFRALKQVHELAEFLVTAGKLPLSTEQRNQAAALAAELNLDRDWSGQTLDAFERSGPALRIRAFLVSLRDAATRAHE